MNELNFKPRICGLGLIGIFGYSVISITFDDCEFRFKNYTFDRFFGEIITQVSFVSGNFNVWLPSRVVRSGSLLQCNGV